MQNNLTASSKTSFANIWNIAYSIILGNLAQTIVAVTDTAFLGRLGEVELGAAAMTGIFYFFFTTLVWGFAIGVQVIVARRLGEGRLGKISPTLMHGFSFTLLIAAVLFGIIKLVAPSFLGIVLTSHNVYDVATEFLAYRGYGIFFAALNYMYRSFYIGISKTKAISYSTLIMALVNIFLDWALIFGTPFTPALGIKGAAIASVTAELSATIFFTIYTMRSHPLGREIRTLSRFSFNPTILRGILKLSLPTMLQRLISYGIWLFFFFMIESMGERQLAVTMVVRNIFMIISIPVFALGAVANTLTSKFIGEGRHNDVLSMLRQVIKFSITITLPLIALLFICPRLLLSLCTDSSAIIEAALPICKLLALITCSYAVCMPLFEAISGTGHANKAVLIEFIALSVYVTIIWYCIRVAQTPLIWVWTSELGYSMTLSIPAFLFLRYYNWHKKSV